MSQRHPASKTIALRTSVSVEQVHVVVQVLSQDDLISTDCIRRLLADGTDLLGIKTDHVSIKELSMLILALGSRI